MDNVVSETSPGYSRRRFLYAVTAVPVLSGGLFVMVSQTSHEDRLRRALADIRLPFAPGHLELIGFEHVTDGLMHHMRAVVCLTWAQGFRRKPFAASGTRPEPLLEDLVGQVDGYFPSLASRRA